MESDDEIRNEDQHTVNIENVVSLHIFPKPDSVKQIIEAQSKITIRKVHESLHHDHPKIYSPLCVSIGPYHHNKLIDIKESYATIITERTAKQKGKSIQVVFQKFIKYVEGCLKEIKDCYAYDFVNSNDFVRMIVIDGLFFIEMLEGFSLMIQGYSFDEIDGSSYPLSYDNWKKHKCFFDMIILENQIPFFVLQGLYELTSRIEVAPRVGETEADKTLTAVCLNCLDLFEFQRDATRVQQLKEEAKQKVFCRHFLDIFSQSLKMSSNPKVDDGQAMSTWAKVRNFISEPIMLAWPKVRAFFSKPDINCNNLHSIPRATELGHSGIHFRKGPEESSILDIKFIGNTLEIPSLRLDDCTEMVFRNLMALEQFGHQNGEFDYSSYIVFLSFLLTKGEDVEYLCKKGIVENYLGSSDKVAQVFNNLSSEVFLRNKYAKLMIRVNEFYYTPCHYRWANLKSKYFKSPWTGLSFSFAVIFSILAATTHGINYYKFITGHDSIKHH